MVFTTNIVPERVVRGSPRLTTTADNYTRFPAPALGHFGGNAAVYSGAQASFWRENSAVTVEPEASF